MSTLAIKKNCFPLHFIKQRPKMSDLKVITSVFLLKTEPMLWFCGTGEGSRYIIGQFHQSKNNTTYIKNHKAT